MASYVNSVDVPRHVNETTRLKTRVYQMKAAFGPSRLVNEDQQCKVILPSQPQPQPQSLLLAIPRQPHTHDPQTRQNLINILYCTSQYITTQLIHSQKNNGHTILIN